MRPFLLAVALLGFFQADDLERLLKQLGAESIEVRDAAAKRLVELGEKAEAAVKRHAESAPAEVASHCREILRRIEEARRLARIVPPVRRITLAAKGRSAKDVVKDLATWAAVPVALENVKDVKLEEDLDNLTLFEALDRVGRRIDMEPFFGLHDSNVEPQGDTTVKLRFKERFVAGPRAYLGHFRVSVRSIKVNKEPTEAHTNVDLHLDWPHGVNPDGKAEFFVTSILDSDGKTVYKGDPETRQLWFLEPDRSPTYSTSELTTIPTAVEGKTLAVKGLVLMRFTKEKSVARFDAPSKCVGEIRKAGDLAVELVRYSNSEGQVSFVVKITGRHPAEPGFDRLRVITRDGPGSGLEQRWSRIRDEEVQTVTIKQKCSVGKSEVTAIEYFVIRKWHEEKFEFELKEIPLPK